MKKNVVFGGLVPALFFLLTPGLSTAGSCCGGGSGANVLLSKTYSLMLDVSSSLEQYSGQWNRHGDWVADPSGSDLKQYRLNVSSAYRFADNWQGSVTLPYVWNRNTYHNLESNTSGLGDTQLTLWYETFDTAMCVYKVNTMADLRPAVYLGLGLTLPTGISPYDDVTDNFDITGRGFYRVDGKLIVDKTVYPWTGTFTYSIGEYIERDVNRDYGTYVEPYTKKLGQRRSISLAFGYVHFTEELSEVTTMLGVSEVQEDDAIVDGNTEEYSGFRKYSLSLSVSWTNMEKNWIVKSSLSSTPKKDNWGRNFPATKTFTMGVSHAFW